jgi:hypothetical protein
MISYGERRYIMNDERAKEHVGRTRTRKKKEEEYDE